MYNSTAGTTNITITGAEQQNPVGVTPGTASISIGGTEKSLPAVAAIGSVTISGALQSKQVVVQPATAAWVTVGISGEGQCSGIFTISCDLGTVTMTVGSDTESVSYGGFTTAQTIAQNLASQFNKDSTQVTAAAAQVTDSLHWQITFTAKATGTAGNGIAFSTSQTSFYPGAFPVAYAFSSSSGLLAGGQNTVFMTVFDSGTCTVSVNNHGDSNTWSGSATTAAGIASALAGSINADTLAQVSATVSGGTINLLAKNTGVASNYPLSSSCSHDTTQFATGSFAISPSGAALTGGKDQINDHGTFSVTVNGHTSPGASWGAGSTYSTIATSLAANIHNDAAAAVDAVATTNANNTATVTLTAKVKGSISNYAFSVSPSGYDAADFATSSFSAAPSGATLTGGWPDATAVDHGTMTVTVNATPYTVNWGATDTPGTIASNLATALAANTTVAPTLSGTNVYLDPKQPGAAYGFSTAYTYDSTNFTHSSFSTANSISDWGTFAVTAGGHADTVPWAGHSDSFTTATALANQINADGLALVNATASADPPPATTSTLSLQARSAGAGTNYSLASSITFDSAHFTAASMSGSNSGASLVNGADAKYNTVYDSGTLLLSVGPGEYTVDYGQGDTVTSLTQKLADKINADSVAHATVSAGEIVVTANDTGVATNYLVSGSTSGSSSTLFPSPSFTFTSGTFHLAGGADQTPGTLTTPLVTLYTYDALDNLLCVEQHGDATTGTGCAASPASDATSPWRVRRFIYDSLGRLLSASNPESNTALDATGNVVRVPTGYSYDADGNLLQKTSPAPNQMGTATQTISYCYDPINRVTGKAYSAQSCPLASPVTTYTYDSGADAIGHLTSLTDQAGSGSYSYDSLGRLTTETRTIAGVSKSMSYDFNLDSSLKAMHYPSGATVTYIPDSAGRVAQAVDNGSNINYISGVTYAPSGQMAGFVSGGTVTSSFTYNKRLQPVNMLALTASQTVFSIGYDFHLGQMDNGNMWGVTNYRDNQRDQTFTYDALDRLVSARNAGTDCAVGTVNGKTAYWGNSYTYNAWGNLVGKTVTKCGAENLPLTALVNNQLSGYGYDTAGNMTSDPTDSVSSTYDAENRIATANTPLGLFTYTYDADGNRVEKSGNGSGILYWYMTPGVVAESDVTGNLKSEYIFLNGERVARRDFGVPGGVFYYFSDHLKTASVITDSAGNIKSESDYYPWGGELQFANNDSNHYKFTGKERDSESGLDYFGARYYGNALGRFLSPDFGGPLEIPDAVPWAEFGDPQSLNLYSYVRNSPTAFDDPDGHDCVVQTRTGDKTEQVSVSSGNCDNVKVGDGQSKTYVPGTVDRDENGNLNIHAGQDGKSIDIGYTPYGGGAGVENAAAAPIPENTNLAYNWGNNAEGYRTLAQASMTVDRIGIATGVVAGANLAMMAASAGGLTTLGDLSIQPTAGEQAYAERLLAQGGKKAVERAIRTLSKRLAEHEAKVGGLKYPGSVEREISGFVRTIQALKNVLK